MDINSHKVLIVSFQKAIFKSWIWVLVLCIHKLVLFIRGIKGPLKSKLKWRQRQRNSDNHNSPYFIFLPSLFLSLDYFQGCFCETEKHLASKFLQGEHIPCWFSVLNHFLIGGVISLASSVDFWPSPTRTLPFRPPLSFPKTASTPSFHLSFSWLPAGSAYAKSILLTQVAWSQCFNMKCFPETPSTSTHVQAFVVCIAGLKESLQDYRTDYNGKLSLVPLINSMNYSQFNGCVGNCRTFSPICLLLASLPLHVSIQWLNIFSR